MILARIVTRDEENYLSKHCCLLKLKPTINNLIDGSALSASISIQSQIGIRLSQLVAIHVAKQIKRSYS